MAAAASPAATVPAVEAQAVAVPLPDAGSLPVCCLYRDGRVWVELLLLRRFDDDSWLVTDCDWCQVEGAPLAAAAAQGPELCLFGDPSSSERFADAPLSVLEATEAKWLRTSASHWPLPGLRGRSPGKWYQRAMFRPKEGQSSEEEEEGSGEWAGETPLRGPGNGALSRRVLGLLSGVAQKIPCALSPHEFLLRALKVWQAFVFHFESVAHGAKAAEAAEEAARQFRRGGSASSAPPEAPQPKSSPQPGTAPDSCTPHERLAHQEAAEAAVTQCWHLLPLEQRKELLQEAAGNIGGGLAGMFMESLSASEDVADVAHSGFAGMVSRQCAEMALKLQKGRRRIGWDVAGIGTRILHELERQMLPCDGPAHHIAAPSIAARKALRAWTRAVAALRPAATIAAAAAQRPPQTSLFLRQPAASQRAVVSFVVGKWRDFARFAACCRRADALVYELGSWEGTTLRLGRLPLPKPMANIHMPEQQQAQLRQLASNFGGRPLRVVPGAASFRHTTLSPAHVTLLRLGLSAFTPSNPILLEPAKSPSIRRLSETTNDCAVQRLAQLFEIPGFAFEVRFHPEVLVERLCQHLRSQGEEDAAKTVKEQSTAKLGAVGPQARTSCVLAPPRPAAHVAVGELPNMVAVSSALPPPMSMRRALGGAWYEHRFAEVSVDIDENASSTAYEIFAMAFATGSWIAKRTLTLFGPRFEDGGCFGAKLVVVGSGPSRAGEGALAPGAYLDVAHVGEDADQAGEPWPPPLPNWSPRSLRRGHRLGLALVKLHSDSSGATGLVFVHQGRAVAGRWLPRGEKLQSQAHLLMEAPLLSGGGLLRCSPVGACSGPPLPVLLETLGPPPPRRSRQSG